MFEFFRRNKKGEEKIAFKKSDVSGDLPLESRFVTAMKTKVYTTLATQESKWLVAKSTGKFWDVIVYIRKQTPDGGYAIEAEREKQNRGVTYAHALCRLAEFERIRKDDVMILPDETVDQKTSAPHFIFAANHDGVGIDTSDIPRMSENGEFFSGSFSEQQRAAVYKFHQEPVLKPIEQKPETQQAFEQATDLDMVQVLDNIEAISELEKIKSISSFLSYNFYNSMVNVDGYSKENFYGPKWHMRYQKEENRGLTLDSLPHQFIENFEKATNALKECPHLPEALASRIKQTFEQIPVIMWAGALATLLSNDKNKVKYLEPYSTDGEGRKYRDIWWREEPKEARDHYLSIIKQEFFNAIIAADKRLSKDAAQKTVDNFEIVYKKTDFFKAQMVKVKDLIDALNEEIKRLGPQVQQRINRDAVTVTDPQTGVPRKLVLK